MIIQEKTADRCLLSRYFILNYQISLHERRHDSHFLKRSQNSMITGVSKTSGNTFFSNSESREYNCLEFSRMILLLSQPKTQQNPVNLAGQTAITAHVEKIFKIL